jgi:para-aminobenzoate synthetase component I
VTRIDVNPDQIVERLLNVGKDAGICMLDSCSSVHRGSEWLLAGVSPLETFEITNRDAGETLRVIDEILTGDKAAVFSISYDFGGKLENIGDQTSSVEPDIFASLFDTLLIHNYRNGETIIAGNPKSSSKILDVLHEETLECGKEAKSAGRNVRSNFTRAGYLKAIETIKEYIRRGETYQTNLTQQITVDLPESVSTGAVFTRIRKEFPAPFAAYIERPGSTVVSASPERFFRVAEESIEASPIKGTRPRGKDRTDDRRLRSELLASEKDRAENTMIVDLMRNDLGRVCEYGSVQVRELCAIQQLPTLFHLVSTIDGRLRSNLKPSDIIRSLFPCGSITGAPKIRTMQIIDELEPSKRGLSMGAIGVYIPEGFGVRPVLDLSVAIRTMVVREGRATFNVGGGIVIDSDPEAEYEESLIKARALLNSLGISTSDDGEHFTSQVV